MDSLTQMALGAAVGGAVLGRRHGARALAWGAVVGTLPDLDTFLDFGSPVADFVYHRGYTHALAAQTAAAPLIALGINAVHRGGRQEFRGWLLAVWLVLVTHSLLDAFTVYGTQLGLPVTDYPYGLGSVFIIDPLYTLPLLVGIAGFLTMRGRDGRRAQRWNALGLVLSTSYLAWGAVAQHHVLGRASEALVAQGVVAERVLATPTPFNSVLWRIVAVAGDSYLEGFHRLGSREPPRFHRYPRRVDLLADIEDTWAVERLRHFTKGYYSVEQVDDRVVITDLRMGIRPYYSFAFEVGRLDAPETVVATEPEVQLRIPRPSLGEVFGDLMACGAGAQTMRIRC